MTTLATLPEIVLPDCVTLFGTTTAMYAGTLLGNAALGVGWFRPGPTADRVGDGGGPVDERLGVPLEAGRRHRTRERVQLGPLAAPPGERRARRGASDSLLTQGEAATARHAEQGGLPFVRCCPSL